MPSSSRDLPGPHPENQRKRRELQGPRRALIGMLAGTAVLAVVAGLGLAIWLDVRVLGRSIAALVASPLSSARGAGLLLVVIAATQAFAALLLIRHHLHARVVALVAALIVVVWGVLQMMLLDRVTWFQIAVFGVGALEGFLVAGCTPRRPAKPGKHLRRR